MKMGVTPRALLWALLLAGFSTTAVANNTPQTLPFSQDWSNAGLLTVNDDWSAVPGIIGYRGDDIITTTGVDAQTVLADGTAVVDVNVNQTNPNTFATGGVTEFALTNPTIALSGSGTADAPFLLLHLDTTGQQTIHVAYTVRDLETGADDAVQQLALQYRIGNSGNFTNIPSAYIADATVPNAAAADTLRDVVLPAAANNQALVQVRFITTNAVGNDENIGIDDISVTGSPIVPTPNLSIDDVSVTEGASGTVTATFTVSLSAAAPGNVTFDIATADGSATTADADYVGQSLTSQVITPPATSYTFNVTVNGDTAIESNETFFVDVTNVSGATVTDGQGQGTITNDDTLVPTISIGDASTAEGNAGQTPLQFTVTSSAPAPSGGYSILVNTANDSATAGSDYVANSQTVTIAQSQTTATFTVQVNGDTTPEADEQLFVNLGTPPAGTQIADGQGVGTITNDDAFPVLSIGNASVIEGNSSTVLLNFPLSLTGPAPAGGVSFTVNTANGTATGGSDFVAIAGGSDSIAAGQTSGTLAVTVNGDTVAEANETFTVTLSAPVNATLGTATATGTITNDDAVEIHAIQGDNMASPLVGQSVLTTGNIVTGKGPQGFTMQAPDARADADVNTSEGIYVFTSTTPTVFVGDAVNVSGTVLEFNGLTEIGTATVTVTSTGNPLPTPIEFNATRPSPNPATPSCAISGTNYECFEFMRVRIADGLVNTGNQRFASPATETYAEVFVTANGRRGVREPGLLFPLVPTAGNLAAGQWDGNPEMFEIDADYFGAVPQDTPITGGSRFSATGVMAYDFGDYELWATEFTVTEAAPVPRPVRESQGSTTLRIGSYNMLRFCDTTNNGSGADPCLAPTPTTDGFNYKVARLSKFVNETLRLPDVLGVVEVENLAVLQALATRIQADTGVTYTARLEEGNDIGGIDVGFLVRTDRVAITSVTQLGKTLTWNDPTGSPTALLHDRPPLLLEATFTAGGNLPFAVMVVHPKSRSCVDQTGGATCVQADVDRNRLKRFNQGKYHAEQIQAYQLAHPGRVLTVVGDFNDYQFTDGWTHMLGMMEGSYDDAANLLDYAGNTVVTPKLWNAVMSLPENDRYSFLFTENFGAVQGFNTRDLPTQQSLDHALLNVTAKAMFAGFDYGRSAGDAPNEWERLCNVTPTAPATVPPGCPNIAIGVSDHDGLVFSLTTDRIFANGFEAAQ